MLQQFSDQLRECYERAARRLSRNAAFNTASPVASALALATLSQRNGHVQIAWSRTSDGMLVLSWSEVGGPTITPPSRQGFGTRVIKQMVEVQLKGEMRFDWQPEGLACELSIPT